MVSLVTAFPMSLIYIKNNKGPSTEPRSILISRSDISAGNSLSVLQYSAVPSCYTDVIFVFDMLFTEINAAAAVSQLFEPQVQTRSSAIAERPCDASCS